jgi:hypothetical protein
LAGKLANRELFLVEEAVDLEKIDAVEALHASSRKAERSGKSEVRKGRIAAPDGPGNGGFV